MLISAVIDYVKKRTGEQTTENLFVELNQAWVKVWASVDTPDALQEVDILPQGERHITLPWFVYQAKGAKRGNMERVKLYTPRPYYHDNSYVQGLYDMRVLNRTPLFKTLSAPGRLTFVLKRAQSKALTISVRGEGDFGVRELEELTIAAGEKEVTTTVGYYTVSGIAKTLITTADVEIYDIKEALVGVIPSSQTDALCQVVQIVDKNIQVQPQAYNYYTILYKKYPEIFTSVNESIPDDYGLILQRATTGEILGKSKDEMDQKRADKFEGRAGQLLRNIRVNEDEGKLRRLDIAPSPYYSAWHGHI